MPDLADLFPGYKSEWISTSGGRIFARVGGSGPPLMLLHGYTQTNVMWHRVAPQLATRWLLVIPDLPGYGWSDVPRADDKHAPYDKRSMAKVMVEVMEKLGHARFRLAGHDRGGRRHNVRYVGPHCEARWNRMVDPRPQRCMASRWSACRSYHCRGSALRPVQPSEPDE